LSEGVENIDLVMSFMKEGNDGTVKPAHAVTSIKQSPVLKRHFFCPVIENCI